MKISIKELRKVIAETLTEGRVYVSPDVEMTPAIQRAMGLFDNSGAFYGYRVEARRQGTRVSGYVDGFIEERGRYVVSAYQIVGGYYNSPYTQSRGRSRPRKVIVSLEVLFSPEGRTTVTLYDSSSDSEDGEVLFSGRGFGPRAAEATVRGLDVLDSWRDRFDEEEEAHYEGGGM